jgi:hypothetical protein
MAITVPKKGQPSQSTSGSTRVYPFFFAHSCTVALMDFGFSTHGVHLDQRLVFLNITVDKDQKSVTVKAPPHGGVYPPGFGYLFFVVDGDVSRYCRL